MKSIYIFIVFVLSLVTSGLANAQRDPIACLMVLCVYAAANGQEGLPGCEEPLGAYKKIRKVTGINKVLDCPATITERIIMLSFCDDNIYPLHEIVDCD